MILEEYELNARFHRMLECELYSMEMRRFVEIAKVLEYFVKLDNFDEGK
jgi:hypothetical protein